MRIDTYFLDQALNELFWDAEVRKLDLENSIEKLELYPELKVELKLAKENLDQCVKFMRDLKKLIDEKGFSQ